MIPSVRGRYRSVPMDELVTSAEELVAGERKGTDPLLQETTLYGVDLYGKKCHEIVRPPERDFRSVLDSYYVLLSGGNL